MTEPLRQNDGDEEPLHIRDTIRIPSETPEQPTLQYTDVAARLMRKYGPGTDPEIRARLYQRLQRECQTHGYRAYAIVIGAVKAAASARSPDRYFAACVTRRMREHGMLQSIFEERLEP